MRVIEVIEEGLEVIEVIEEGPIGPAGPSGLSTPTEIVTDFPTNPVTGTLYIKV